MFGEINKGIRKNLLKRLQSWKKIPRECFLLYWWPWSRRTLSVSECDGREWKGATHPVSQHTYTRLSVLLQERTKRDWKGRKGAPQCFKLIMFWVSVSSGLDGVKGQDRTSLWPITVSFIKCLQRKNKSPEILYSRLAMEAYSLQDKTVKGNSRSPNAKDSYYQVEQIIPSDCANSPWNYPGSSR